jgi:tRNA(fMet)-specific endonuclease VapC
MSGRFLLDTNIIIDLLANEDAIKAKLVEAEEVFVSSITIGELFYWPNFLDIQCRRQSH